NPRANSSNSSDSSDLGSPRHSRGRRRTGAVGARPWQRALACGLLLGTPARWAASGNHFNRARETHEAFTHARASKHHRTDVGTWRLFWRRVRERGQWRAAPRFAQTGDPQRSNIEPGQRREGVSEEGKRLRSLYGNAAS